MQSEAVYSGKLFYSLLLGFPQHDVLRMETKTETFQVKQLLLAARTEIKCNILGGWYHLSISVEKVPENNA